jgi:ADP-ribose pyrophosphatase
MEIERPKSKQPIPENAKKVFEGIIFDTYQWQQEMYDGTKKTFEKLKRPDTVIVFPVLPDGKIILTEQEQPGKEPFIGATGGMVDDGEEILEAAKGNSWKRAVMKRKNLSSGMRSSRPRKWNGRCTLL